MPRRVQKDFSFLGRFLYCASFKSMSCSFLSRKMYGGLNLPLPRVITRSKYVGENNVG